MAGSVIPTIVLLAVIQAAMCTVSPHPAEFFPGVKGNLTKIVWAHAVNSVEKLEKALSSEDVMMLEADVVIGKLNNTNNPNKTEIPIMAHPPQKESDLSLEDFLNITIQNNGTKGIKLDFKTKEAFDESKDILKKFRPSLKFPVFLNADILRGPVNATIPSITKDFLKDANLTIPESTLSIGWTTRYGKEFNITEGRYTSEQIKMMIDAVKENQVTQPITYPVRAALAANDIDVVKTLINNTTSTKATLTIWSSESDSVNVSQLSKLIKDVGIDKVYLDVSDKLKSQLDLSAASATSSMINLSAMLAFMVIAWML